MKYISLLFLLLLISCSEHITEDKYQKEISALENINPSADDFYINPDHKDEYHFDVTGYDKEGRIVNGEIDIRGRYGSGTIKNKEGEDIDINIELNDDGFLLGLDSFGNIYELTIM